MNFRRSDFDVTNRINTTDPVCVKLEVARIYRSLSHVESQSLTRAFDDLVRLYVGDYPGYTSCDTEDHDLQHVGTGRVAGVVLESNARELVAHVVAPSRSPVGRGSRGRPSRRSPMMLRCTSLVPPPMVSARLKR